MEQIYTNNLVLEPNHISIKLKNNFLKKRKVKVWTS